MQWAKVLLEIVDYYHKNIVWQRGNFYEPNTFLENEVVFRISVAVVSVTVWDHSVPKV